MGITLVSKETHQIIEKTMSSSVKITENSVVLVDIDKEKIVSLSRDGANLKILLQDKSTLILTDYFNFNDNSLVIENESDRSLYWAKFSTENQTIFDPVIYEPLKNVELLLYHDSTVNLVPWLLGGAAIVGGAAALGGGGGSSNKNNHAKDKENLAPENPEQPIEPESPLNPVIPPVSKEAFLNNLKVSGDGLTVYGEANEGDFITVWDSSGALVGSAVANAHGQFFVNLSVPQKNAELIAVRGENDTTGVQVVIKAPDYTIPASLNSADIVFSINADGNPVVSGTSDYSGHTIYVYDLDKTLLGKAIVDENGFYEVVLPKNSISSESVYVAIADLSHNESATVEVQSTVTPTVIATSSDRFYNTQTPTFSGPLRAPADTDKVEIKLYKHPDLNNPIDTVVLTNFVDDRYSYTSPLLNEGYYRFTVRAIDKAGNVGNPASLNFHVDITPPAPPTGEISMDGQKIFGKGEALGTLIAKSGLTGDELGRTVIDRYGNYNLKLAQPLKNGESFSLIVTDLAKNESSAVFLQAPDYTKPIIDSNSLVLTVDGTKIIGSTEANINIQIYKEDRVTLLGEGVSDNNGDFYINLSEAQVNGETIVVYAIDTALNQSFEAIVLAAKIAPMRMSSFSLMSADEDELYPVLATHDQSLDSSPITRSISTNLFFSDLNRLVEPSNEFSIVDVLQLNEAESTDLNSDEVTHVPELSSNQHINLDMSSSQLDTSQLLLEQNKFLY